MVKVTEMASTIPLLYVNNKGEKMIVNDVVQFNENHKWCGCLGIVAEVREIKNDKRYMVGVPMPQQGTAYIFVMESDNAIEYIGAAVLGVK